MCYFRENSVNVSSESSWLGMRVEGLLVVVKQILLFTLCNLNFRLLTRYQCISVVGIRPFLISEYKLLPESDKSHKLLPENAPHKILGKTS